ncbi:hypothetical protein ABPG75_007710 [Micractinium tetrahymenae]
MAAAQPPGGAGAGPPARLQYRKSSSGGLGGRGSPVDWEHFDEEMSRVDARFSNPKFDSLRHVLTVLSSSNAEQQVEEMREQRDTVEGLVDAVVEGYHAGFNKSIHNYSQILRLFTDARMQLETLRRSLESARRRLSAQSRQMVAQYQRDLMLTDTLRLLGDIQGCVDVPARVQRLEESKEWPMAVSLLLDGCNKLARQELQAVGALRELAAEMGRRRAALLASLVAELEARVYRPEGAGVPPTAGAASSAAGDAGALAAAAAGGDGRPGVPRLPLPAGAPSALLQRRNSSQEAEWSAAAGNLSARGLPPRPPGALGAGGSSAAALTRTGSWCREQGGPAGPAGDALSSLASLPRRPMHRRAQTLGGLMPAASGLTAVDGHLVDTELPLAALVDCVAQLGGLHEAQAALRRHMPAQLRLAIARAVESFPASQRLPLQDERQLAQQQQQQRAGAAGGQEDISVPPGVVATAQALAEHVLGCCLQVFRRVTDLLQALSMARVPKASSGLELLLRQAREQQHHQQAQQQLLAGGSTPAASAAAPVLLVGPPGPEATRAEFAESADRHVAALTGGGGGGGEQGGRMAALLSMPWRAGSDASAAERAPLRSFLESFLRMEFLPAVYVSARARCSATLEDSEAFKPRTRLRAPYQAGAGPEGRPLLPAALATERMVEELLGWAALVPPFATHLTGVVENVLGRVVDAFEAHVALTVGRGAAGRWAEFVPMAQLMAKEPAAALLGSPVAFFVGRNTEAMESFVSSAIAAGFGANDEQVEVEILQKLFQERPIPAHTLLSGTGDVGRLVSLAALSDSLDYVAEVVHRCTAGPGSSSATGGRGGQQEGSGAGGGSAGGAPGVALGRRSERLSSDGSGASTPLAAEASQQSAPAAAALAVAQGPTWQQQLGSRLRAWRKAGGEAGSLTEGLAHLADRYRALAGMCVRALRLDLLLLTLHHMQQLPRSSYVCASEEEAREVDECVAALARLVGRLEEGLEPYLPPHKRAYCFGCLAPAAARFAIWLLPDIPQLNQRGVQRMCRMLASLQPALAGAAAGGGRPDAARAFDRAKLYYTLLSYSAEGLVATAAEKPHRFSPAEYAALLGASVAERPVSAEQRAALARVLADAGRAAKPTSKANAALQGAIAKAVKAIKQ